MVMDRNPSWSATNGGAGLIRAELPARQLHDALASARHMVAESLTIGLLAATLADAPGVSRTFLDGVVVYATEIEASLLRVDPGLLTLTGSRAP